MPGTKFYISSFTRLICTLILVWLIHVPLSAQNSRTQPILLSKDSLQSWNCSENWRFSSEDNIANAGRDCRDSNWILISPSLEKGETNTDKFTGLGWFRYYFKADSSLLNTPIYLLAFQGGASEIYLDGELLATAGLIKKSEASVYRNTKDKPILFNITDTGWHVLAVRYENLHYKSDDNISGFIISLSLASQELPEYIGHLRQVNTITNFLTGVFLALGIIHLLIFLFYRKGVYNFYFALYNFSIAAIAYLVYLRIASPNPFWEGKANSWIYYPVVLFSISMFGFVHDLFGRSKKKFYLVTGIGVLLMVLYAMGFKIAKVAAAIYLVYAVIDTFITIIRAMIRKEKGVFIVGFGNLMFFCVVIFFFIAALLKGGSIEVNDNTLGSFGWTIMLIVLLSFPLSISAYLAWQFARANLGLQKQLAEVQKLSAYSLQQEQEKKEILENQNQLLEQQVAVRTQELQIEKKKSDDLLLNILPQEVAEELKTKGESKAQYYDEVSVLFTDFVNFTKISESLGVNELLEELNIHFTAFDQIMERYGLEKIKTIGDAYLAVSGLPVADPQHAQHAVQAALDILDFVAKRKTEVPYGLDIRIGINSGALIAGIIGVKKFAYDIWGDTVNTAARMEQSSAPGKVNISEHTYKLVKADFSCIHRGKIEAKGKGAMDMYFVTRP